MHVARVTNLHFAASRCAPALPPAGSTLGSLIAHRYTELMAVAKVMISIPEDLLERVDRLAGERGASRSAFLQEVVRRELGWPDPVAFDAAVASGRHALAAAGAFESAELIREERDARDSRD